MSRAFTLAALAACFLAACSSSKSNQAVGAPVGLAFAQPPQGGVAGATLPSIEVQIVDSQGQTVSTSLAEVQIAIGSGPSGAVLSGTKDISAAGGVVTFQDLSLDKAGTYTLTASGVGLTSATSAELTITAGQPASLVFQTQPGNVVVGGTFSQPVTAALLDAFGNVATGSSAPVTVAIANNPGGATLSGTATVNAANGVASFADLSLDKPGVGYTLSVKSGALSGATSSAFDAHAATQFVYTDPPTGPKLRLVRDASSTNTTIVLDLVTSVPLTAYSVAMNLPVDRSRVQASPTLLIPGTALDPGTSPVAAAGSLSSDGLLAVGLTQKAAGSGAVTTDTALPAGSTLLKFQLDVGGSGLGGTVFDGAALGPTFRAALMDKLGNNVANSGDFGIGKLSLQ